MRWIDLLRLIFIAEQHEHGAADFVLILRVELTRGRDSLI